MYNDILYICKLIFVTLFNINTLVTGTKVVAIVYYTLPNIGNILTTTFPSYLPILLRFVNGEVIFVLTGV